MKNYHRMMVFASVLLASGATWANDLELPYCQYVIEEARRDVVLRVESQGVVPVPAEIILLANLAAASVVAPLLAPATGPAALLIAADMVGRFLPSLRCGTNDPGAGTSGIDDFLHTAIVEFGRQELIPLWEILCQRAEGGTTNLDGDLLRATGVEPSVFRSIVQEISNRHPGN